MATHASTLARRIPWTEDLVGYSSQTFKESDTTEMTQHATQEVGSKDDLQGQDQEGETQGKDIRIGSFTLHSLL